MSDGLQILVAVLVILWTALGTLSLISYLLRDRTHEGPRVETFDDGIRLTSWPDGSLTITKDPRT